MKHKACVIVTPWLSRAGGMADREASAIGGAAAAAAAGPARGRR